MPQKLINVGTVASDATYDSPRTMAIKINENFAEVYGGVGSSNYTALGSGAITRATQDKIRDDAVSVSDYQDSNANDDQLAFERALATGRPVKVPYRATPYLLTNFINLTSGAFIFGEGRPTIKMTVHGRAFRLNALSNVTISGIIFDGNKVGVTTPSAPLFLQNAVNCLIEDCDILNGSANMSVTLTSTGNRFVRCRFFDSSGTALEFNGPTCANNTVSMCEFQRNVGFGVTLQNGAHRTLIESCWTNSNGLELVGLVSSSHHNRVVGCHAEGCGDNGFSISGYNNAVSNNISVGNAFNGIHLFGSENTCSGNVCLDNGRVHDVSFLYYNASNVANYCGIVAQGEFGGTGQNNTITGNFLNDSQATQTQKFGIRLGNNLYSTWMTATFYAVGAWVRNSGKLYQATSAGTSGATIPSHTNGAVSDGGVTWLFAREGSGNTTEAYGNVVTGNRVLAFAAGGAAYSDGTINQSNMIQTEDHVEFYGSGGVNIITGGFSRKANIWTSGQAVTYGTIRYAASGALYRVTNIGGTGTVQPSHTTIGQIVTGADGVAWMMVTGTKNFPAVAINAGDVRFGGSVHFPLSETATGSVQILAGNGTPEGKATAGVGSIYLRGDGGTGATFYVKESGTGSVGWAAK